LRFVLDSYFYSKAKKKFGIYLFLFFTTSQLETTIIGGNNYSAKKSLIFSVISPGSMDHDILSLSSTSISF
jgi:hypothetical protein